MKIKVKDKTRLVWHRKPTTQIVPNKKRYRRKGRRVAPVKE